MKKMFLIGVLLMTTVLIAPTFAEPVTKTWVVMHGRVERYGTDLAYGHCGVWAKVGGRAQVFVAWIPGKPLVPVIFNFYAARLMNTTLVELNYSGADLYISGLWNVYNVTFTYEPHGSYSLTIELLVDHGEGKLSVTGNWTDFTVDIKGIELITGKVKFYAIKSIEFIPIGDCSGSAPGMPDGKIDIRDLVHVARAYGSTPKDPLKFENFISLDFDFDFKVGLCELTTIAANLGTAY